MMNMKMQMKIMKKKYKIKKMKMKMKKMKECEKAGVKFVKIQRIHFKKVPVPVPINAKVSKCGGCHLTKSSAKLLKHLKYHLPKPEPERDYYYNYNYDYGGGGGNQDPIIIDYGGLG